MIVRYTGPKPLPYKLNAPIPFVSRSEYAGTLEFNPDCDITNMEWAWYLIKECGGVFERVETKGQPIKPGQHLDEEQRAERRKELIARSTGKRFMGKAGKWNAFAYVKRHKLQQELGLKKLQIGDKVVHWELVPIALADVGAEAAPIPWNKPTKDAQEVVNESVNG